MSWAGVIVFSSSAYLSLEAPKLGAMLRYAGGKSRVRQCQMLAIGPSSLVIPWFPHIVLS